MRLRNCLGMIWSVSTLSRSSSATIPVWVVKRCMFVSLTYACSGLVLVLPVADVDKVAGYGGSSGHGGADQMCASTGALAAFKIPVAGGSATLARLQFVSVHAQAHGTA